MTKLERSARYSYLWKREYWNVRRFKRWSRAQDHRLQNRVWYRNCA